MDLYFYPQGICNWHLNHEGKYYDNKFGHAQFMLKKAGFET